MFRTFIRTWWRENKDWPNGLEPNAGRKHYCASYSTEQEAREACERYNSTHDAGRLSRKMEYTS